MARDKRVKLISFTGSSPVKKRDEEGGRLRKEKVAIACLNIFKFDL